jgi:UDP-N-acetylglucosamine 2-epimerase
MATEFGIELDSIRDIEPLGFLEFLQPAKGLALPDSGGGPGGGVHSGSSGVTLRENMERPETVTVGSNTLAGPQEGAFWILCELPYRRMVFR